MDGVYRIGEIAALTGITVRALHHYDRLGLVPPSAHSEGGHRLYGRRDLLRLQQVLTLRFLGFPLAQIRPLLDRPDFDLVASLWVQRRALRERAAELERIATMLDELTERRLASGEWDWNSIARAAAAVQGSLSHGGTVMEQMRSHYTEEQMQQFAEVGRRVPEAEQRDIERLWTALIAEVRLKRDLDPASDDARTLADRWNALTERTMAGYREHPELIKAIEANYEADRFSHVPDAPRPDDFAFIARVNAARS